MIVKSKLSITLGDKKWQRDILLNPGSSWQWNARPSFTIQARKST